MDLKVSIKNETPLRGRIMKSSSGGAGTDNYNDLRNKPSINGVPLVGNKTSEELGIPSMMTLSEIEADENRGFLASVDKKYLTNANTETDNNLMSHTDYLRIPDNVIGVTVRGYTAAASGTPTYAISTCVLVYDENRTFLGFFGSSDQTSEKTFSFDSYPTARYARINQPGGNSPVEKLIRWNYAGKAYYSEYSRGVVGEYNGAFTAENQSIDTGIRLDANKTYCVKFYAPRLGMIRVYCSSDNTKIKNALPYFDEVYLTTSGAGVLKFWNGSTSARDPLSVRVFETDSVQLKAESVRRTYRVDKHNPTYADYASITRCLFDLKDDDSPKTIEVWGGDYDIFAEYTDLYNAGLLEKYTGNDPSMDYFPYCVWVPANTHIIGKGIVRLRWEPDPSTDDITPNQCKTISPLNVAATATIENIEVYCKNGRYCLHNDGIGKAEFAGAVQRFINCRFYKYGNDTDPVSGLTYGFLATTGFGIDFAMRHVYENCLFVNYANNRAFYGHSRSSMIALEKNNSDITLTNCVFVSDGSPCIKLGNSASNRQIHIRTMFNGCSFSGPILSGLEGSASADCANGFDIQLLNCGSVTLQILDPDNEYPPQAYNTQIEVTA